MLIVGELINSTRKNVQDAIKARNAEHLVKLARGQMEAGAAFIDVNCAVTAGDEVKDTEWAVDVIQGGIRDVNICVDSPNHLAIARALEVYRASGELMINSITADEERVKNIVPLAMKRGARLVALTMDEHGMPDTAEGRFEIAKRIVTAVRKYGFAEESLYIDALIRPVSTEPGQAAEFLKSIPMIKSLGRVKTICGLSNVSFGLPDRKLVNSTFLAMALHAGLDAAIMDPLDRHVYSAAIASTAIMGRDEYCGEYLKAFRAAKLI